MLKAKFTLLTVVICGALASGACKGGTKDASPSAPTPTNHNPTIASMNVSPSFGIAGLNTFTMTASASDADNDTLTYTWSYSGGTQNGASVSATLSGDGTVTITLTVTDGKGGTAADTRTVTIGTFAGKWTLTITNCGAQVQDQPGVMTLTQTGGAVGGSLTFPGKFCNASPGLISNIDPGQLGTVDSQGNFTARMKAGDFLDFFMTGKMDSTGRKVTGTADGSGFNHDAFIMTKQ